MVILFFCLPDEILDKRQYNWSFNRFLYFLAEHQFSDNLLYYKNICIAKILSAIHGSTGMVICAMSENQYNKWQTFFQSIQLFGVFYESRIKWLSTY